MQERGPLSLIWITGLGLTGTGTDTGYKFESYDWNQTATETEYTNPETGDHAGSVMSGSVMTLSLNVVPSSSTVTAAAGILANVIPLVGAAVDVTCSKETAAAGTTTSKLAGSWVVTAAGKSKQKGQVLHFKLDLKRYVAMDGTVIAHTIVS